MAIVALDLGRKRIGVAISRSKKIVQPLTIWLFLSLLDLKKRILALQEKEPISEIVIGYTAGETTDRAEKIKKLIEKEIALPVILVEEDFTTKEAQTETGDTTNHVDDIAAVKILERYLEG